MSEDGNTLPQYAPGHQQPQGYYYSPFQQSSQLQFDGSSASQPSLAGSSSWSSLEHRHHQYRSSSSSDGPTSTSRSRLPALSKKKTSAQSPDHFEVIPLIPPMAHTPPANHTGSIPSRSRSTLTAVPLMPPRQSANSPQQHRHRETPSSHRHQSSAEHSSLQHPSSSNLQQHASANHGPNLLYPSDQDLELSLASSSRKIAKASSIASTLSTPTGTSPAYGDAFISPQSARSGPDSPDPLNLISPVARRSLGTHRQHSPSPAGTWGSTRSRPVSTLDAAMGDSGASTLPHAKHTKRKADDSTGSSGKKRKHSYGPSPVKTDNFYSLPPNMPLPKPPYVEIQRSTTASPASSVRSFTPTKRPRGRPKGSKAKPTPPILPSSSSTDVEEVSESDRKHLTNKKSSTKPKVKKKKHHHQSKSRPTTFTSNLPLALPEDFDSQSPEEWDRDGDFELEDDSDSDVEMALSSHPSTDVHWQTPNGKPTSAPLNTSVIKHAQRKSVLAKLAEFIEDLLDAESSLPDCSADTDGLPHPASSFFVVIDNEAILKPAKLQTLGKLIRSCAMLKAVPQPRSAGHDGSIDNLRSIHDIAVGDLQKTLRLLETVVRIGESVRPFPLTASKEPSTSTKKIGRVVKRRLGHKDGGLPDGTPSDEEDDSDSGEANGKRRSSSRTPPGASEDPANPLLSSSPQRIGLEAAVPVTEADQKVLVEQLSRSSTSLMAVDCCLSLLSIPHLDQSLLSEDIIGPCFDVLRSTLELVVYPFVEACSSIGVVTPHPLLATWIETMAPSGAKKPKGRKKKAADAQSTVSTPMKNVPDSAGIFGGCAEYLARIFKHSCSCMGQFSKLVHLPDLSLPETIMFSAIYVGMGPFFAIEPELLAGSSEAAKAAERGRMAMDVLAPGAGRGGTAMKLLRMPALNLLRDIFAQHQDQRQWMIEELLTSLTRLPDMKKNRRQYSLKNGYSINAITALLLQLVQTTSHGIRNRIKPKFSSTADPSAGAAIEIAMAVQANEQKSGWRHGAEEDEERHSGTSESNTTERSTDYDLASLRRAVDGPMQAAHSIAKFLMVKVSPTKVVKSSDEFSYASVVDNLVTDLLAAVFLPEWPAASLLLTALCHAFEQTIDDTKATPDARGVALEHIGNIAAHIRNSRCKMKTRQPTAESQALGATTTVESLAALESSRDVDGVNELNNAYMAVLDFLRASEADDKLSRSASDFFLSQWGSELASSLIRTSAALDTAEKSTETEARADLPALRTLLSALHRSLLLISKYSRDTATPAQTIFATGAINGYDDVRYLSEQLVHTTSFASSFDRLCHLLIMSLNCSSFSNRAKALRGLTAVYNVEPGVLTLATFREAIECRLLDDNAVVREAAVNLLSKYLLTQPEDSQELYGKLMKRSTDTGLSVRKRILKLLASLYQSLPSISMRIDACLHVVRCVSDEDPGMQEMAIDILGDFWLRLDSAGESDHATSQDCVGRTVTKDSPPAGSSTEFGEVISIIVSVASQIRDKPSPLEEVFRRFNQDKTEEGTLRLSERLRSLSDVLIGELAEAEAAGNEPANQSATSDTLARIKAVYLIVSTNPAVLSIAKAKSLLPFIKSGPHSPEDFMMLETLMKIFRVSLPLMPKTALAFANQLAKLLLSMINSPPRHSGALQEIIACYAAVTRCHTHDFPTLIKMMGSLLKRLRSVSAHLLGSSNAAMDVKSQLIMSEAALLCEHADFGALVAETPELEQDVITAFGERPIQDQVFELLLDIRQNSPAYSALALQNMGALFRGFPSLMESDQGKAAMSEVFASGDRMNQETLLKVFLEFLAVEETSNALEQSKTQAIEARDRAPATKKTASGKGRGKINMKELVGDTESFAKSSVSSNLVAQYIEPVLEGSLAIGCPTLQRVAMDVLKCVVLQGLSHPLQCVPALVCLETAGNSSMANRALQMHEHLWTKHETLLAPHATRHMRASFEYQAKLHEKDAQNLRGYRMDAETSTPKALLHAWYSLLRDKRATRLDFVKGMTRLLDIDTSSAECSEETVLLVRYVADNLATLDFKTMEEVFVVVGELRRIVSVTGVQVKFFGETFIRGLADTVPAQGGVVTVPSADPIEIGIGESAHAGAMSGNATLDGIDFGEENLSEVDEEMYQTAGDTSIMNSRDSKQVAEEKATAEHCQPGMDVSGSEVATQKRTAASTARMSITMGTVLLLRNHLKELYGVSEDRCNKYVPGKKQSAGADRPAVKKVIGGKPLEFDAMPLALDSVASTYLAIEQLVTFEEMMNQEGTLPEEVDEWQE